MAKVVSLSLGLLAAGLVLVWFHGTVKAEPAPEPSSVSERSAAGVASTYALKLVPLSSLGYAIALPEGWVVRPIAGHSACAMPAGRGEPIVCFLLGARVSDLRYNAILEQCNRRFMQNPLFAPDALNGCVAPAIRAQLADSAYRWPATKAVQAVLDALRQAPGTAIAAPEFGPGPPEEVVYRFAETRRGQQLVDWGHASMAYLENPLLSQPDGAPGVTSLLSAGNCAASPAEEASFAPLCSAILHSFSPEPGLERTILQDVAAGYQQEVQILLQMGRTIVNNFQIRTEMINDTMAMVRQMQWETSENFRQNNMRVAKGWINALAGTNDFYDPQSGKVYNFRTEWTNYRYNCIADSGPVARGYFSNDLNCAELGAKYKVLLRPLNPLQE